jgi:hypothetical protein
MCCYMPGKALTVLSFCRLVFNLCLCLPEAVTACSDTGSYLVFLWKCKRPLTFWLVAMLKETTNRIDQDIIMSVYETHFLIIYFIFQV